VTNSKKAVMRHFKERGCQICGLKDPVCLVAHHIDPLTKNMKLRTSSRCGKRKEILSLSVSALKRELAGCLCLCSNCHLLLHANRFANIPAPRYKPIESMPLFGEME